MRKAIALKTWAIKKIFENNTVNVFILYDMSVSLVDKLFYSVCIQACIKCKLKNVFRRINEREPTRDHFKFVV